MHRSHAAQTIAFSIAWREVVKLIALKHQADHPGTKPALLKSSCAFQDLFGQMCQKSSPERTGFSCLKDKTTEYGHDLHCIVEVSISGFEWTKLSGTRCCKATKAWGCWEVAAAQCQLMHAAFFTIWQIWIKLEYVQVFSAETRASKKIPANCPISKGK